MSTVCKHRVLIYFKSFEHISAFSKLTSDYTLAHANNYRALAIDCTQRLSALIVRILKMRFAGQNRLVSRTSRGRTAFIALISNSSVLLCRRWILIYIRVVEIQKFHIGFIVIVLVVHRQTGENPNSWGYLFVMMITCYQVFVRHFTACYNNVLACGWLFTCMKLITFAVCYL